MSHHSENSGDGWAWPRWEKEKWSVLENIRIILKGRCTPFYNSSFRKK